MPQPYPGQQWKHGWKPLTPQAILQKNHGRTPGPGSALARAFGSAKTSSKDTRPSASARSRRESNIAINEVTPETRVRRGDAIVVAKWSTYTGVHGTGSGRSLDFRVGKVTSVTKDGKPKSAEVAGRGNIKDLSQSDVTLYHIPDINADEALKAGLANPWHKNKPDSPTGAPFNSLSEVKDALADLSKATPQATSTSAQADTAIRTMAARRRRGKSAA